MTTRQEYKPALAIVSTIAKFAESPPVSFRLGFLYQCTGIDPRGLACFRSCFDEIMFSGLSERDPYCMFLLGTMYQYGYYVAKDIPEAIKWYLKAADQGHVRATYGLSWLYSYGPFSIRNPTLGIQYCKLAADRGLPQALNNWGLFLETGNDGLCEKDIHQALSYYKKAFDGGNFKQAAKNLGKIYFHGKSGIRPNKRLGLHYFAIAEPVREFKAMEKRIMKKKEGAQGSCMRSKH